MMNRTYFNASAHRIGLIAVFILSLHHLSCAQGTSGYIRYEERTDVLKLLSKEMVVQYRDQIEQYSSSIFRLYFNDSQSLYKAYFEDRPLSPPMGNRMRVQTSMLNVNNFYFTNTEMMISQVEALGKTYYMRDTLKVAAWKFGTDKRTILGYECQVAYYTDKTNPDKPLEITAWYTMKIRPYVGPERYNTLPGGILALDINSGDHYWVARSIELRELTVEEKIAAPEPPKKAALVSYAEYQANQAAYAKKQKAVYGR
jgi:GLPGLI family protein